MKRLRVLRVAAIGGGVLALLVLTLFWILSAAGVMCLVPTARVPGATENDREAFVHALTAVREDALGSLMRSFDSSSGFFIYERHPHGTVYDRNNDIRQLLASRILAEEGVGDEEVRALHKTNLDAIMREWYREEGENGFVFAYEKSKLGANAMLLRTLVASPFFKDYEREARALREGIRSLQNNDGSFEPWFREPGYAYDRDYLLTFYSGEAILALMEHWKRTGEQSSFDTAKRAQDHYLVEYVEQIDANYYPAYVPWHTLSLSMLFDATGDVRYRDAMFALTDKLLELQDTEVFVGRFYDPETPQYGSPHVSSDAVYTEGLAVAYEKAKEAGDARSETYGTALTYAFHNLRSLQFHASWYRVFDDRETAQVLKGGFRTNACDYRIRIDSTAHAVDALTRALSALGGR